MLPVAECCVCRQAAGPHNYYGARVSSIQFEDKITMCCVLVLHPLQSILQKVRGGGSKSQLFLLQSKSMLEIQKPLKLCV